MAKSAYIVEFAENHNCLEERTSTRIRAFLQSTEPLVVDLTGMEAFDEAKTQIEHLALCCELEKTVQWDAYECAAALRFLHWLKPIDGTCFCNDTSRVNATCGFHSLLIFIEDQMWRIGSSMKRHRHAA